MNRIEIGGLPLDIITIQKISNYLVKLSDRDRKSPALVSYLNAHNYNIGLRNLKYRQVLSEFDLVYADGWSMIIAAWLYGHRLPSRLTAYDFFVDFCQKCQIDKKSIFLFGGEEGVADKTEQKLKEKYPELEIKGSYHGFFNKTEEKELIRKINKLKPDLLLVNMGSPKQEIWLYNNLNKLNIRVGWCVGGLFNYLAGVTPRCPYWLGKLGFEWLYRLCVEPERLWRRYLLGLPLFVFNLIKLKLIIKDNEKY